MSDRINKDELIKRVAAKTGQNKAVVAEIVDITFEEIYEAFKREEKVTIRNFDDGLTCSDCSDNRNIFLFAVYDCLFVCVFFTRRASEVQ